MFLNINGHSLYYEDRGAGEAVLLLHHGLGSVRAWDGQVLALLDAGFRVILYDRWGYGASSPRPCLSIPFFEEDLQDLHGLLDHLEVEWASLVGHSDGGTLALYFAAQFPERVSRVITIAAHIYVEPKMDSGIRGVKAAYEESEKFRRGLQRLHAERTEAVFCNWFDGWVRPENLAWDMRPLLRQIACPILVVQGVEDEHATPQHARDIASAIPGAALWLVPGAHHMLPQENGEVFNERMVEFFT